MTYEIDVPSQGDIVHELEMIAQEFSLGSALRERATYRLWRIWKNKSYYDITSDDPDVDPMEPKYHSWGAFLRDFLPTIGISRSTVYSRMKAYSIMNWIGYTDDEILEKMSSSSMGYGNSVNLLVDWDMSIDEPIEIRVESLGTLDNQEEAKVAIRDMVESTLSVYERSSDAIDHIKRDLVGVPVVDAWQDAGELYIDYEDTATGENGRVKFIPDDYDYPLWVCDVIATKFRIKRKLPNV